MKSYFDRLHDSIKKLHLFLKRYIKTKNLFLRRTPGGIVTYLCYGPSLPVWYPLTLIPRITNVLGVLQMILLSPVYLIWRKFVSVSQIRSRPLSKKGKWGDDIRRIPARTPDLSKLTVFLEACKLFAPWYKWSLQANIPTYCHAECSLSLVRTAPEWFFYV